MTRQSKVRLGFTETLVLHAVTGRLHSGVARATDALIAQECALSVNTARDARRALQAAKLIDCKVTDDDELVIVLADKSAVVP